MVEAGRILRQKRRHGGPGELLFVAMDGALGAAWYVSGRGAIASSGGVTDSLPVLDRRGALFADVGR